MPTHRSGIGRILSLLARLLQHYAPHARVLPTSRRPLPWRARDSAETPVLGASIIPRHHLVRPVDAPLLNAELNALPDEQKKPPGKLPTECLLISL